MRVKPFLRLANPSENPALWKRRHRFGAGIQIPRETIGVAMSRQTGMQRRSTASLLIGQLRAMTSTLGFLILYDGMNNELKEFWPDIRRKVFHKNTP